ncbi:MAG: hypothetical protein AAGA72_06295 [Pseudomonadota bacterium]
MNWLKIFVSFFTGLVFLCLPSNAQIVGSERLKREANSILFVAATRGDPAPEMLDLYATNAAGEISLACGEFLSVVESLGLANAQLQIALTWTEQSVRNYIDYSALAQQPGTTGTDIALGMAKIYAPTAIIGVLSEDIRRHTRNKLEEGCASEGVKRVTDAIQAHVRLRFLEGAESLVNLLNKASASAQPQQIEPFPCPDFDRACFRDYGYRRINDLVGGDAKIYTADFANQADEVDEVGFGLAGWMALVSERGQTPSAVPKLEYDRLHSNRHFRYSAMLCYIAKQEDECATLKGFDGTIALNQERGSVEFPRRLFSTAAPLMLVGDGYDDAAAIFDQLGEGGVLEAFDPNTNVINSRTYLHFAANRIRAGDQTSALRWLNLFKARMNREFDGQTLAVPGLMYDVAQQYADRFQDQMTAYQHGWDDIIVEARLRTAIARGLADLNVANNVCADVAAGRYNTKDDRGYDITDRLLGTCGQTFAALRDRTGFDRTMENLKRINGREIAQIRALAGGAIAFGDRQLLEEAQRQRRRIPATASYVTDDADRQIALALAASGNLTAAWELAGRMVHVNNELRVKFELAQGVL